MLVGGRGIEVEWRGGSVHIIIQYRVKASTRIISDVPTNAYAYILFAMCKILCETYIKKLDLGRCTSHVPIKYAPISSFGTVRVNYLSLRSLSRL
jgi:hypothetical protein